MPNFAIFSTVSMGKRSSSSISAAEALLRSLRIRGTLANEQLFLRQMEIHTLFSFTDLLFVVEEALAGLDAQLAGTNHLPDQHVCAILAIVGLVIQHVHDVQHDVPADQIAQVQGAHGVVAAQLHSNIDIFRRGNASCRTQRPRCNRGSGSC